MHFMIHGPNGRSTLYTPKDLQREARAMAKQAKARIRGYHLEVRPSGHTNLCVDLVRKDGTTVIAGQCL